MLRDVNAKSWPVGPPHYKLVSTLAEDLFGIAVVLAIYAAIFWRC